MKTFSEYLINEEKKMAEIDVSMAVDHALAAYWQQIKMAFPNAKSKELMPADADEFRNAATKVTKTWLKSNANNETQDSQVNFSSFNRNQNATQTTQWNDYHP